MDAIVDKQAPRARTDEIGITGLKVYSGYVDEEFLRDLRGVLGRRKFREMSDNDATVGAVLAAFTLVLRSVKWRAYPADESEAAKAEADFVESLFADMSHSWEDTLAEILSMLPYGWSYLEMVLKRRDGPHEREASRRSDYVDGRIGVRKLAIRPQDTLDRWEMQDDGGITGMWQMPPTGGDKKFVSIERALLFRTTSRKNNPEGVSILRTAYESWYFLKQIRFVEATGIERELAGVPVVRIPGRCLVAENRTVADTMLYNAAVTIARDLKTNEQGGLVISGDPYRDNEGNPIALRQMEVELLKGGGARAIDTTAVKNDYKRDITRAMLADFLMLGQDKGAYNLGESKVDLFMKACDAVFQQIAAPLNRFMIPRIWDYNGLDRALMPKYLPDDSQPMNPMVIGALLRDLTTAGAMPFPNEDLENHIYREAGLPEKPEGMDAEIRQQALQEAAEAARRAFEQGAGEPVGGGGAQPAGEDAGSEEE